MLLVFALLCNDIWLDNEAVNIVDDSFFFRFYSVVMSCSLCCEIMNKITGTGWHARFRIIMKPYIFISALYTVWNMEGKWMAPLHLRSGIHCEHYICTDTFYGTLTEYSALICIRPTAIWAQWLIVSVCSIMHSLLSIPWPLFSCTSHKMKTHTKRRNYNAPFAIETFHWFIQFFADISTEHQAIFPTLVESITFNAKANKSWTNPCTLTASRTHQRRAVIRNKLKPQKVLMIYSNINIYIVCVAHAAD